jgi:hypothetical protein
VVLQEVGAERFLVGAKEQSAVQVVVGQDVFWRVGEVDGDVLRPKREILYFPNIN